MNRVPEQKIAEDETTVLNLLLKSTLERKITIFTQCDEV